MVVFTPSVDAPHETQLSAHRRQTGFTGKLPNWNRTKCHVKADVERRSDLGAGLEDGHVPLRQVLRDFQPAATEAERIR